MFSTSWRVGRVAGIEVRVDSSWVVIALLITYSMYLRLSILYRDLSTGGAVGLAIVGDAVLRVGAGPRAGPRTGLPGPGHPGPGHHPVPVRRGHRARVESRGPGDEFLIALVGPLTSGILAGLFGIIAGLGRDVLSTPLAGTLGYLAWTNLLLAAFNLVPGFPLDGGRLLRSAIWKATGSLGRATRVASVAGRGVGWLLVASGVAWLLAGDLAGRLVHQFHGQLVKTTGDGILATFDGPGRAIRCVAALGAELGGIGLQIRAGLHTGEIELRDGDVGGIAVHIAARVMAAAGPGQILTTRTVRDLVVGSDIAMDDLGTRPLKGVQGVWQLFAARP